MKHRDILIRMRLTAKEREMLQYMADGLVRKEIAKKMHLSIHTVKFHYVNLRAKAGLLGYHVNALIAWAFRNKLVK
jgi:DNA-binding CsgD family transcriptional regulator